MHRSNGKMQNGVYPGFAKFQTLSESSKFVNASKLQDSETITSVDAAKTVNIDNHHTHNVPQSRTMNSGCTEKSNNLKTTLRDYERQSSNARDFILIQDNDSLELCIPHSQPANGVDLGNSTFTFASGDAYADDALSIDRRRKGNGRRSNRNIEEAHRVNWSRYNISATMERFEPTQSNRSSSATSSVDYGLAASVTDSPHFSHIKHPPEVLSYGIDTLRGAGPTNHVYSYAYYEPGAVKCHTNIPRSTGQTLNIAATRTPEASKNSPHNSIRTLLSKGLRSKSSNGQSTSSSPSVEDRHTYTTRYGTTENLYEEVNEQKMRKVLSDNRIAVSTANHVKEELRRVQHNHFRVLEELNLSLEALIMPPSPPNLSPDTKHDVNSNAGNDSIDEAVGPVPKATKGSSPSAASLPQKPRRFGLLGGNSASLFSTGPSNAFSNTSLENLSATFHSMDLKDQIHNSANNPEFDEGDLDSGFSGSGSSSGASYNESVRDYKAGSALLARNQEFLHTKNTCCSPTSSSVFTSKSSVASLEDSKVFNRNRCKAMPPSSKNNEVTSFDCVRVCSDTHLSMRPVPKEPSTGTESKKGFWIMKP